jgi:hypothetical protein
MLAQEEQLRQDLAVGDDEDDDDTPVTPRKKGHRVLNAGQELQAKAAARLQEESKAFVGCVMQQLGIMQSCCSNRNVARNPIVIVMLLRILYLSPRVCNVVHQSNSSSNDAGDKWNVECVFCFWHNIDVSSRSVNLCRR